MTAFAVPLWGPLEPGCIAGLAAVSLLAAVGGLGLLQRKLKRLHAAIRTLAQERTLLRTLVDSLPDYVYVKDLDSRFLLVNAPGARMMGASRPGHLLGKTDFDFYPHALAARYRADEQKLFDSGEPLIGQAEPCWEAEANAQKWILTTKVPLRDEAGRIVGLIGSGRDITEIQHMTEELQRAKAGADAANRAKGEFLANMSHEVRTPMNAILGMTELALETSLSAEQRECLLTVKTSAESLLGVINDILDYSKIEAGKLELERIEFSLAEALEEAVRVQRITARQKGLSLTCAMDPAVPRHVVGDPTRLKQVLTNLLGNALKFTESGAVAIQVRLERQDASTAEPDPSRTVLARFTVRDTGIGISPEKQQLIFQPFAQSDASTTRKYGGTGLGLTICKRLVGMMGGRIWVESALGQGSCFHFTVPLGVPAPMPASAAAPVSSREEPPAEEDAGPAGCGHGLRILLAEDNPVNRRLALRLLERRGHRVSIACDGVQVLDALRGQSFDLLLMDLHMPNMDGLETTAAIREMEKTTERRLPIVAMTACAMEGDREKCLAAGMDGYIAKPIRAGELFDAVERFTGNNGRVPAADDSHDPGL